MLQEAIRAKDFEKAKEIITSSDNPFDGMQDYHVSGIFDALIREKAFDVIDILIENDAIEMDIYEYDSFDKSIFKSIIWYLSEDEESIAFLNDFLPKVDSLNDELGGKSLLTYALDKEVAPNIIKALVANGCDSTIINKNDENLIHEIVKKYVRKYDKGLAYLAFFYEEGLDIDKPNVVQKTPLHMAVESNKIPYMEWLLQNGADVNSLDKEGRSVFYIATAEALDVEKYSILREYGTPDFDQTPSLLYKMLGMMSTVNKDYLKLFQLVLEDGADLYQEHENYDVMQSAINVLAKIPSEYLKVALDSGQFDINRKDNQGNTILHKVCMRETLHEERRGKEVYRRAKLLVKAGADVNATNDKDETPMLLAANDNMKTKTVELLLSHKS